MPDTMSATYADISDEFGWSLPEPDKKARDRASVGVLILSSCLIEFAIMAGLSLALIECFINPKSPLLMSYVFISLIFSAFVVILFKNNHLYTIEMISNSVASGGMICKLWTVAFLMLATLGALTKVSNHYSRLWLVSWFSLGLLFLVLERLIVSRAFRLCVRRGFFRHSVVVVGPSTLAQSFVDRLRGNRYGVQVDAVFNDGFQQHIPASHALRIDGNLKDLLRYHRQHTIDTVVITLPMTEADRIRKIVKQLSVHALRIRLLPGELAMEVPGKWYAPYGEIPGIHLMAISDRPIALGGIIIKSMFDRAFALLALILFAPLMLACIVGIKLSSPGPVLFRQRRIGYRNRIFEVYKFRTMRTTSTQSKDLTARNDPRIFKFGELMRKLSLDELPQIFNVLKGDMSLVGPRPHMPEARAAGKFYFDAVSEYASRHRVKPGITGWAQINGWRGPTETLEQIEQRVNHDLYYIDNWSLGLDIKILIKTACGGFFGENAF